MFISEYFGFPMAVSFHQCSILILSSITEVMYYQHLKYSLNNPIQKTGSHFSVVTEGIQKLAVKIGSPRMKNRYRTF